VGYALALLLASCGSYDEVTELLSRLRRGDAKERPAVERELLRWVMPEHVGLLLKEIDRGPAAVRLPLIRALGVLRAKAELRELVSRYETESRVAAAVALRGLGEEDALRALMTQMPRMATPDDKRVVAARLTSNLVTGADVVKSLVALVANEKDRALRRAAILSLITHRDERIAALLEKVDADGKDDARWDAREALILTGSAPALEATLAGLEADALPADAVARLLGAACALGDRSILPRLRGVLEKAVADATKRAVIDALVVMRDRKATTILAKLAEERELGPAAADAIVALADPSHIEMLKDLAKRVDATRRQAIAEALLRMDDASAWDLLAATLAVRQTAMRLRAVRALATARRPRSVDLLLGLLEDPDGKVADAARTAVVASIEAMCPYVKLDPDLPAARLREFWRSRKE